MENNIFDRRIIDDIPIIRKWLDMYSRSSKDTIARLEKEICVFFNAIGAKSIQDIENFKAEDISKVYRESKVYRWSNNTTNSYIGTAKLFYKWANINEVIKPNNAIFTIKRLKNDAEPKYCPPREDMHKIIDAIIKHTKKKRLRVMVKTCLMAGLRRQEVCNLKIKDLMEGQIRVYGKGSKVRFQMVSQELLDAIWDYILTERAVDMANYKKLGGNDLDYIFVSNVADSGKISKVKDLTNGNKVCPTSFYQQVKNICEKANIEKGEKISPHTLRHFFGTSIYEQTLDLALTQEAMRHSDMSTTRRYVHVNEEKMKEALRSIAI